MPPLMMSPGFAALIAAIPSHTRILTVGTLAPRSNSVSSSLIPCSKLGTPPHLLSIALFGFQVKLLRSNLDAIQAGNQSNNQRNANLKMRGGIASFFPSPSKHKLNSRNVSEDLENQNPNMETTPLMMKAKKINAAAKKEPIKSSAEKKGGVADEEMRETPRKVSPPRPRLKSTFSARNLFSGKDILSQISEFCHELKKLAAGKDSAAITEEEKKDRMRKILEEDGKAASKENAEEEKALISTKKTTSLKKKCKLAVKFEGNEEKKSKILKEARARPPTPQRFPSPSSHHHHQLKSSKAFANSISSSSPLSKIPKSKSPVSSKPVWINF
ncbi:hypothetical protein MA16_Dca003578 [Dendrobium catenatum]|uniref:Uncharacterized protein n=1 Tax=Dendrobium catenatum TaxID=906689 RepID=A0A2I0WFE0_9ASPA|nr:hypothetical protein MA16_Dca003578 [Dendrobium catenatum]